MPYPVVRPVGKYLFKEDVENVFLDLVGLIPLLGEPADALNAYLYAQKGEYLFAALSLISLIPEIGDVVGKGGKISTWAYKNFPRGAAFVGKHGPKAAAHINELKGLLRQNKALISSLGQVAMTNKKLAPHMKDIEQALQAFMGRDDVADETLE